MGLNSHLSKLKSCRTVIELLSIATKYTLLRKKNLRKFWTA